MESVIAVDIETHDPHLKKLGPGSIRKDGFVIGVGVYSPELGLDDFLRPNDPRLKDVLARPEAKVFHNAVYDVDWLENGLGLHVNGRIEDTMTRAVLLDTYQLRYGLDACCQRAGLEGKNKSDTIEAWWVAQGNRTKAIEHLRDIPYSIVGKYCRQDCKATYDLYRWQAPRIEEEGLTNANGIECSLYPWLMQSRRNGINVNWDALWALSDEYNGRLDALSREIREKWGDFNPNSGQEMEKVFKAYNIPIEYSAAGRPSFTKDALRNAGHPLAEAVLQYRALSKLIGTFIDGQFVDMSWNGRIYSSLYPMKRDGNGTITGRFSSANINMQNVPARTAEAADHIRSLFIADDGCYLGAFDYSQIEYRVFTHFAVGDGADDMRAAYAKDTLLDFHAQNQVMMGWVSTDKKRNKELRGLIKNLGFGILYGLGKRSFAEHFRPNILAANPGMTDAELMDYVYDVFDKFERRVPFMTHTAKMMMQVCQRRGYIRTVSDRRVRVPPAQTNAAGKVDIPYYRVINYECQGSAADIVKKAISDSIKAGVWSELHSHTMVHDELVFSIPKTKAGAEAAQELHRCMKYAYADRLRVPLHVDTEIGVDWGHCTEETWQDFLREVA